LGGAVLLVSIGVARIGSARLGLVWGLAAVSLVAIVWPTLREWVPERACQVPSSILLIRGRNRTALIWGWELGLGVCSYLVTPAFYALVAVAIGAHPVLAAAFMCVVYGLTRGLAIAGFALVTRHRNAWGIEAEPGIGLGRRLEVPLIVAIVAALIAVS
jgi:hypothetical protein